MNLLDADFDMFETDPDSLLLNILLSPGRLDDEVSWRSLEDMSWKRLEDMY